MHVGDLEQVKKRLIAVQKKFHEFANDGNQRQLYCGLNRELPLEMNFAGDREFRNSCRAAGKSLLALPQNLIADEPSFARYGLNNGLVSAEEAWYCVLLIRQSHRFMHIGDRRVCDAAFASELLIDQILSLITAECRKLGS